MLFEFLGKCIVQPRRDIFEKVTGLFVSQSAGPSFLTQVEFDAACAFARQHDLLGMHVESIRSVKPACEGRFGNRQNRRGGKHTGCGRGMGQLNRHCNSAQSLAQPSAQSSAQPSA